MRSSTYRRIYALICRVPPGRVVTYGQVAALLRLRGGPRQVGYALAALPDGTTIPWHRVINSRGAISLRGANAVTQRILLAREGVHVGLSGRVDLRAYRWNPRQRGKPAAGASISRSQARQPAPQCHRASGTRDEESCA